MSSLVMERKGLKVEISGLNDFGVTDPFETLLAWKCSQTQKPSEPCLQCPGIRRPGYVV